MPCSEPSPLSEMTSFVLRVFVPYTLPSGSRAACSTSGCQWFDTELRTRLKNDAYFQRLELRMFSEPSSMASRSSNVPGSPSDFMSACRVPGEPAGLRPAALPPARGSSLVLPSGLSSFESDDDEPSFVPG